MNTQEATQLPEISMVISTGRKEATVRALGDGSDRLCINFGHTSLFLTNFAAELLARDLIAEAVKLQYTLEEDARRSTVGSADSEIEDLKTLATIAPEPESRRA